MALEAPREILSRHLKAKGKLRSTPERFAVLDAVLQCPGHFDVESLYYRMLSNGTRISKATVYNTLELLQQCGLVSKYRFAEKTTRYEKTVGRPSHHHLICLECGEIIEFVNERLNRLQDDVCDDRGFVPQSSSLQIFGRCAQCRKRG
jgi:Fur family ferric uptake transcriptional regulator